MNVKWRLILLFLPLFFLFPLQIVQAATVANTFQITTEGSQQTSPFIYNNFVVYTSLSDIWGFDLKTKQNIPTLQKGDQQFTTGFYQNLIIYENSNPDQSTDVYMYNLKTKKDIFVGGGSGSQAGGVTNGKVVAYIDGGACGSLKLYDIHLKNTKQIFNSTCQPLRISKDILVFPAGDPHGTNVKGYDLKKNQLFDISTAIGFQESASIFEEKVVWLDYITGARGDYNAIKMKNLKSGEEKTIYESSIDSLQSPAVSNRYVVWSQSSAQHIGGVMGTDLKTGEIFTVQEQGPHQNSHTTPAIWRDTAVWQAWRTGNGDIYGSTFSKSKSPTPTPTPIPPPISCIEPPSGLVSWWPGDGDATDLINGNTGTLQNGANFASGQVGQAFSFDGLDDFVQAPTNNLPIANNNRTLEMWVKINEFLADAPDPHSPLEAFFAGYGNFGSGSQTYQLGTAGNVSYFSQWGGAVFGPSLVKDRWYHIAVTNSGNTVNLFIDGGPVANGVLEINTPSNTQFNIGRVPGSIGDIRRLNGYVDEATIYNRALSPDEIKSIFDSGVNGKCKPEAVFSEDFNETTLNTDKWEFFSTNGGNYSFDNGSIVVPGGTSMFYIRSKNNPFPTSGPFTTEFGIQYITVDESGIGVAIGFEQQNGYDPNNVPIAYWQGTNFGLQVVRFGLTQAVIGSNPDLGYHAGKIVYDGDKYQVYLDGVFKYTSPSSANAKSLWFGNPFCCRSNWTGFKLDYIKVTKP